MRWPNASCFALQWNIDLITLKLDPEKNIIELRESHDYYSPFLMHIYAPWESESPLNQ